VHPRAESIGIQVYPNKIGQGGIMTELSLFNAIDNSLIGVSVSSFEESLLLNILFQDKMLIHESMFFNSELLAAHAEQHKGHRSLFEQACVAGLIVPAFRNPNIATLEEISKTPDRHGDLPHVIGALKPRIERIISSVDRGLVNAKPVFWPANISMGELYRDVLRAVLSREDPPEFTGSDTDRKQLFDRVWPISKRWRYDFIDDAEKLTKDEDQQGIRRTQLFNLLGWSLGVPKSNKEVRVDDIFGAVSSESKAEVRLAVELYLKWLAQIKHVAEAKALSASVNFPIYDVDQDFILDSILRSKVDSQSDERGGGFA
jgi:hypothetical protein